MTFNNWFEMNNWPIREKLILHFLLISTLPALCLGVLIGWATNNIVEKQTNEHTSQLIGNVNKSLDFYASNIQNITYFISFNPLVKQFLAEGSAALADEQKRYEASKFLQGFTTLYPEAAGILVVNTHGEYFSNEMYARTGRSLTEEDWYQQAVEAKGIFKLIGHPSGRNVTTHANYKDYEVISVVRAILDPERQTVQGVILIDLKLRVIAETVKDVRLGKNGYLMVIDENGDAIYAPRQANPEVPVKQLLNGKGSGYFTEEADGAKMHYIYQTSSFTKWTTVGVFAARDSVMEIREINLYVILFVFVVCMLGISASYYLSHSISRPITQLTSFMRKVEEGNMHIRYTGERQDEVGLLGRSFNRMLAQISKLLVMVGEEQRSKREAELRSLQAQIKPHFLYNTLDTIQWLARKNGAGEVTEVVESLSRLFRIGLSKGNEMIGLPDELDHIRSYLIIQKTRYKDKLHYTVETDPGLNGLAVLKLILQPIVENAIYHGIKERRGPGHISVRVTEEDNALVLRIEDNGAGMTEEKLRSMRANVENAGKRITGMRNDPGSSKNGYGLANVQERIRLSFGEQYGLTIDSEWKQGTVVTIRHPVIRAGTEEAVSKDARFVRKRKGRENDGSGETMEGADRG
ncbi:sensor histidine kinase [Paenibacillus tarimensis]